MRVNDATADTTILLMLYALRRISKPFIVTRKGLWKGAIQIGHGPQGKVLGIPGMGSIGKAVASRAKAFGMKVQYTNRSGSVDNTTGVGTAEHVPSDQLLRTSGVLSLHLPLSSSSHHIISRSQSRAMKDGVVVANTSRGQVVNEAALVEALQSG